MEGHKKQSYMDAVAYLAERFRSPEQLERIEFEKQRIEEKSTQIRSQLTTSVKMQMENSKMGITRMGENLDSLKDIKKTFEDIDSLCANCINLLPNYQIMKELNLVRYNIKSTLEHGNQLLQITEKMNELKELIDDDRNILLSHQNLCELRNLKSLALSQTKDMPNEHAKLKKQFEGLENLETKLEESLFHIMEEMPAMAVRRPATLVKAFQVIEREEKFDRRKKRQLKQSGKTTEEMMDPALISSLGIKNYKFRMLEILRNSILKAFDFTFATLEEDLKIEDVDDESSKMKGLALDGEMQDSTVRYLKEAENMINDLNVIKNDVSKCSPPSYSLFDFFVKEYHKHYYHLIIRFVNQGTILSAKDTLLLVKWVKHKYEVFLSSNGYASIEPSLIEPLEDLMINFRKHVKKLMEGWIPRILAADRAVQPELIAGKYYTDSPVTLFKILNQQLTIGYDTGYPLFTFQIVQESIGCILMFQASVSDMLTKGSTWKEIEFEYILALVNNAHKSLELLDRFKEKVLENIDPKFVVKLDYKNAIFGFLQLAEVATKAVAKAITRDLELAFQLVGSKEWVERADPLMYALCDTYKDYFINDVMNFIASDDFYRLAKECLSLVVFYFVFSIITGASKYPISSTWMERFTKEYEILKDYWLDWVDDNDVDSLVKPIEVLKEILEEKSLPPLIQKCSQIAKPYSGLLSAKIMAQFLSRRKDIDPVLLRDFVNRFNI